MGERRTNCAIRAPAVRAALRSVTTSAGVVVDDLAHGIDLVVRGDDLFASTGRQILLARLLGRETPPAFLHHPLVMKAPTQKLSKSDGDSGVRDLRAAGWNPGHVIGHAAYRAGLITEPRDLTIADLPLLVRGRGQRDHPDRDGLSADS
jgi:glutamyl/glutaminyl-tRNA synthetase